jgi:branched-subunit amino acid transport protein AzlD
MTGTGYLVTGIVLMALATQLTRFFPFLIFSRRKIPSWLVRGAKLIPGAVMTILVFTSLPFQINLLDPEMWVPWLSAAVVALLHLLFRHPMVSIIGGTGLYMVLIQVV